MRNLWDVLKDLQSGDIRCGFEFTEHKKIRSIIKRRLAEYRYMYTWVPQESIDDVECGLRPKLIELAINFKLPTQRNEGRIISYFSLRILGECDFLLKKITGMRQMSDDQGKTFYRTVCHCIDDAGDLEIDSESVESVVINGIEQQRLGRVLAEYIKNIPADSNDLLWLRCYFYRLRNYTWRDISEEIDYPHTDFSWLKDNTFRFMSRLRNYFIHMGEKVNCRVCGIYTDVSGVGISVIDAFGSSQILIWSKTYDDYSDLDKIESKLGDIFRQYDKDGGITYILMNDGIVHNDASVIIMRYLSHRECFVECVDTHLFASCLSIIPNRVHNIDLDEYQRWAFMLVKIKQAQLELISESK